MVILGIKINNLLCEEILRELEVLLTKQNKKFYQIITVNPEFILQAQKDKEFKEILNSKYTLNIADGIGLKFASWRQGKNLKCRWAGIDLMQEVLKLANQNKQKIFLVANKNGLSNWQETASAIKKVYSNIEVLGINLREDAASPRQQNIVRQQFIPNIKKLQLRISTYNPDIIFCSLGAPIQEKILYSLRNNKNVKLAMGVGGSFDFLTGKIKRAPKWLQVIGLEWLYRLIQEPSYRWRRIFRAVIIFPIRVLFKK